MKKYILIIFICLLLVGCNNKKDNNNNDKSEPDTVIKEPAVENNDLNNDNKEEGNIENEINTENDKNEETGNINNNNSINSSNNSNNNTNNTENNNITNNSQNNNNNNNNDIEKEESNKEEIIIPQEPVKENIDALKEYYCTEPFVLEGKKCTYLLSNDASIKYTCTKGTLNGNKCNTTSTFENTLPASQIAKELCSSFNSGGGYYPICICEKDGGTYNNIDKKCYKTINVTVDADIEYYCTSGTILNGTKCQKYYETDAPFNLTCPQGYTLNGIYCEK